jgi:hypothetical protein
MRAIILLFTSCFLGCSTFVAVTHEGSEHKVRIEDGIPKSEGQKVVDFVVSNMEMLKGHKISVDAKYENLVSISKWSTPGMPSAEDLKCKYSANFYYGGFGNNVCIGSKSNDKESLVILGSCSWIQ